MPFQQCLRMHECISACADSTANCHLREISLHKKLFYFLSLFSNFLYLRTASENTNWNLFLTLLTQFIVIIMSSWSRIDSTSFLPVMRLTMYSLKTKAIKLRTMQIAFPSKWSQIWISKQISISRHGMIFLNIFCIVKGLPAFFSKRDNKFQL